jgi:hypothetical protein
LLLAPACTHLPVPGIPSPTPGGQPSQPPAAQPAAACAPTLPEEDPTAKAYETVLEEFDVKAPSGSMLYGLIRRPDPAKHPGLCLAAVVLVPGGINPGRMAALDDEAEMLSAAGMVVLTFNAEGRVDSRAPEDKQSEGIEDYNGFRGQDGLGAVVEYALALPYVINENVGVRSQSYGITMAAGCLGRHPDLPVKYLVDGEGPPDSYVTCKEPWSLDADPSNDQVETILGILGRYSIRRNPSDENKAFWAEREAVRFIGGFRGRYLRLQAEWDHAQPPSNPSEAAAFDLPPVWWRNKHAADIVDAAVAGGVSWVRVNLPEQGNPVNAVYDYDHPPAYLPGTLKDRPWAVRAILEMARMPA